MYTTVTLKNEIINKVFHFNRKLGFNRDRDYLSHEEFMYALSSKIITKKEYKIFY